MRAQIEWQQDEHGDWIGDVYCIADDPEQEAYMIIESGHFIRWSVSIYDAKKWCEQSARHLMTDAKTASPCELKTE